MGDQGHFAKITADEWTLRKENFFPRSGIVEIRQASGVRPVSFDFTHGHIVPLTVRDAPWHAAFNWSLAAVLWFLYFARLRWRTASLVGAVSFTLIPIPFVLHSVFAGGPVLEFAIVWIIAAGIWLGYFRQRPC